MPSTVCFACRKPLAKGASVAFQGENLVHAGCWREERPLEAPLGLATHRRAERPPRPRSTRSRAA
jgi:hypothetical protein